MKSVGNVLYRVHEALLSAVEDYHREEHRDAEEAEAVEES